MVSRQIRGLPDDMKDYGWYNLNSTSSIYNNRIREIGNKKGIGFFNVMGLRSEEVSDPYQESLDHAIYNELISGRIDTSPDMYSFSFMGNTGHFVYPEPTKSGRPTNVLLQTESRIKMISTLQYEDINKYRYYFSDGGTDNVEEQEIGPNKQEFPVNYHLQTIVSPIGRKATFKYDGVWIKDPGIKFIAFSSELSGSVSAFDPGQEPSRETGFLPSLPNRGESGYVHKTMRIIEKIETPHYLVEFKRDDKNQIYQGGIGNNRIDRILVYYKDLKTKVNKLIKHIHFEYESKGPFPDRNFFS